MSMTKRAFGAELSKAVGRYRTAFVAVALLSLVINVLIVAGPIYLMLVYDSVLPSANIASLLGLFGLVILAYVFMGLFENMRAGILMDVGSSLDQTLAPRVQQAISNLALRGSRGAGDGLIPMRDLDSVRAFLSSSGPATLIDLPCGLLLLIVLGLIHPWLAVVTGIGMAVLLGLTVLTDRATREAVQQLSQLKAYRSNTAETNVRHVEVLTALGMRSRMRSRWETLNQMYLSAQRALSRTVGLYGGISKTFRMTLQSGVITVGALLVLDGMASAGVIFAASMISGRVLAPVDQAIGNWRAFSSARVGWNRLKDLLSQSPEEAQSNVALPKPSKTLEVSGLFVAPPGSKRLTVNGVDLKLNAGDGLGILGPSAAGKSSLGRALVGVWQPARGTVRLDGATLDQWSTDRLGGFLGYLPQSVELLEGTIGDNIARFDPAATSETIISAAKAAGVHDMIVKLPNGYDTAVGPDGQELSSGQRQRVGLARALYGDPFLVLLDEPNSNLDTEGEAALERAIAAVRRRGGIIVVIAHRPSVLSQVSHVMILRDGRVEALGPRDEVLRRLQKPNRRPAPQGAPGTPTAANA